MIVLIHLLFLDSSSPLKAPRFPCLKFFPHFLQLPWIVATCSVHDAAVIRVQANKLPRMLHRVRHGCCRHWTHIGQRNWHRPRCCGTTWKTEIELVHGTRLQTSTVHQPRKFRQIQYILGASTLTILDLYYNDADASPSSNAGFRHVAELA